MPRGIQIPALIILTILVAIYLYSLPGRIPDIDDAWIGEHAYWLAETGQVKSELMRGITSQEEYLIVHHKLFTLHGALAIKLFGFSLYTLKSVSLVYFILFLILFTAYTSRIRKMFGRKELILALILVMAFPWTFKYSFVYRPEMLLMVYGFISYILIGRSDHPANRSLLALLSGAMAGLAVVTHLNGLVIAGAGFIFLLLGRRWREVAGYMIGIIVVLPIYFYDFNGVYGWGYWLYQMTGSPALDSVPDAPLLLQPLINLVEEHRRYFHNPKIIFFTLFTFTVIAFKLKYLWKEQRELVLYTAVSMLLMGLIGVHKSRQYLLIFYPYLLILTVLSIRQIFSGWFGTPANSNVWLKRISFFLLLTYLAGSCYYNIAYASEKFGPADHRKISESYFDGGDTGAGIIAPMVFIFNEIDQYQFVQGEVCYTELQKQEPSIRGTGFIDKANSFNIRYIYLTPYYSQLLGVAGWTEGYEWSGYRVMHSEAGEIFMKKVD